MSKLAIVTATLDYPRAEACIKSWLLRAAGSLDIYIVGQAAGRADWEIIGHGPSVPGSAAFTIYGYKSREILGVVPAFNLGVTQALYDGADIIACLHDDLLIEQDRWDETVINLFKACPRAGLVGFGGAKGLGADELYKTDYHPMQLARQGFRSNMRHAEAHGIRSEMAEPVACLDGFSQIGTANFWRGIGISGYPIQGMLVTDEQQRNRNLFTLMQEWGVIHHFYDGMLGCFAKRLGYMTWYLPVACHHFGGVTAVADVRYHKWADQQAANELVGGGLPATAQGDQYFWQRAHAIGYDQFRDVLPIRI